MRCRSLWWAALLSGALCLSGFVVACGGNEAIEDCADCPNLSLQPACIEAANDCDQFSGEDRENCLEEARALCE